MPTDTREIGPYRRLVRRHWILILSGVLWWVLCASLAALSSTKGLQVMFMMLAFGALAGPVASGVLTRCPYCGWVLLMRFDPKGFHGKQLGVSEVCSHCHRDLTKPLPESGAHR